MKEVLLDPERTSSSTRGNIQSHDRALIPEIGENLGGTKLKRSREETTNAKWVSSSGD